MNREFICGSAGTGKTYLLRERIRQNPRHAILCATTGIAAVNLSTVTINSVLKYFDLDSLGDAYVRGRLVQRMRQLAKFYSNIAIDEISMLDGQALDILDMAASEAGIGLILTGDFCQLPPIKGTWAFEANCWPSFAANVTRLTKNKRQSDERYIAALNAVRIGDKENALSLFKSMPEITWAVKNDFQFDGTTIMAKNKEVDNYNQVVYNRIQQNEILLDNQRWGYESNDWQHIPNQLSVKLGAYVMILSNKTPSFEYVNGDCGHIVDFEEHTRNPIIQLVRTGQPVVIERARRDNVVAEKPSDGKEYSFSNERNGYIIGGVTYNPLRLAYASTVHKSQGLSLDRVQLDIRGHFFSAPNMMYVALSRCREPNGLRIVGSPELLKQRINVAEKVGDWL